MMSDYQYKPHNPQVSRFRLSIWVALIGIIILVTWAAFAKIDQVTRATGSVIAK